MMDAAHTISSAYDFRNVQYDNNGNVKSRSEGGSSFSFTYSGSNVPVSYTKIGVQFTLYHDPDGNITGSYYNGVGNYITNTYDPFTLMTMSMGMSGSTQVNYQYDGRKERILKTVNNSGNQSSTLYLRGTNDYPLTQKTGSSTSSVTRFPVPLGYIYGSIGLVAVNDGRRLLYESSLRVYDLVEDRRSIR